MMSIEQLQAKTGCSEQIALKALHGFYVGGKPSSEEAILCRVKLLTKPQAAQPAPTQRAAATTLPTPSPMVCDNCGRSKPQKDFRAARGICSSCARNPGF